jgi:hypothetical protein
MDLDLLLARIIAGYTHCPQQGKILHIKYPTPEVMYEATEIYYATLQQAQADGHLDDDDIFSLLYDMGIWNDDKERAYSKNLSYEIEQFKVSIYENFSRKKHVETVRLYLNRAKEVFEEYSKERHMLDHVSCKGIANFAKWIYIIENSTFVNGKRADWSIFNLSSIMSAYYESFIPEDTIRTIAKSEQWSTIWSSSKKNGKGVFSVEGTGLTHDQRRLILWSSLYDNVGESSECPSDKLVQDDDALDGWLIVKRKERERETLKTQTESKLSEKISKADEIYLVADDIEEAREIDKLNNVHAAGIKRARVAQLKREGQVNEIDFQDSRQKIQMILTNKQRKG